MKRFIAAFFMFGELLTSDLKFLIQDYRLVENFDFQIELVTPDPDIKIIADCQSFINGLHGYVREGDQWIHQWAIPLSEAKCDALAAQSIDFGDHAKDFCLFVDQERQEYSIGLDLDNCIN